MNNTHTTAIKRIQRNKWTFIDLWVFKVLSALAGGYGLMNDSAANALQMNSSILKLIIEL